MYLPLIFGRKFYWSMQRQNNTLSFKYLALNEILGKKTIVTKMNNSACLIWASLFSLRRVKYQFTHPDGQVEVKSKIRHCIIILQLWLIFP